MEKGNRKSVFDGIDLTGFVGSKKALGEALKQCKSEEEKQYVIKRAKEYRGKMKRYGLRKGAWGYQFAKGNRGLVKMRGVGKHDFRGECLFGVEVISEIMGVKVWRLKRLIRDGANLPNYGRIPGRKKLRTGGTIFIHKRFLLLLFRLLCVRQSMRKTDIIKSLAKLFQWSEENNLKLWGI